MPKMNEIGEKQHEGVTKAEAVSPVLDLLGKNVGGADGSRNVVDGGSASSRDLTYFGFAKVDVRGVFVGKDNHQCGSALVVVVD